MSGALAELIKARRFMSGSLPWGLAFFAAANAFVAWRARTFDTAQRARLLATEQQGEPAVTPRYDWSVGRKIVDYLRFVPDATKQPLVVLTGMSQMYTINDRGADDRTIPELLDDALAPKGTRVFGLAAPNLNNEEALLYFLAAAVHEKTQPALFAYGICFDKFRNVDVRRELTVLLLRPEIARAWRSTCDESGQRFPLACAKMRETLASTTAHAAPIRVSTEQRIRAGFASALPIVSERESLNGTLQNEIYELRNFVFRIKPSDKRPIIQSRYELNQQLLELLVRTAKKRRIQLAFYVIPLNPRADNPYIKSQYEGFKSWVESLAKDQRVPFANLENAVPSEHWGEFMDGPDFKHFRGEGHRLTARALLSAFDFERMARAGQLSMQAP